MFLKTFPQSAISVVVFVAGVFVQRNGRRCNGTIEPLRRREFRAARPECARSYASERGRGPAPTYRGPARRNIARRNIGEGRGRGHARARARVVLRKPRFHFDCTRARLLVLGEWVGCHAEVDVEVEVKDVGAFILIRCLRRGRGGCTGSGGGRRIAILAQERLWRKRLFLL